jgi:hypothetical protein
MPKIHRNNEEKKKARGMRLTVSFKLIVQIEINLQGATIFVLEAAHGTANYGIQFRIWEPVSRIFSIRGSI